MTQITGLLAFAQENTPTKVNGVFSSSHSIKDATGHYLRCQHVATTSISGGFYYPDLLYNSGNSDVIRPNSYSCKYFIRY